MDQPCNYCRGTCASEIGQRRPEIMPAPRLPDWLIRFESCSDRDETRIGNVMCQRHRADRSQESRRQRLGAQHRDVPEYRCEYAARDQYRHSGRCPIEGNGQAPAAKVKSRKKRLKRGDYNGCCASVKKQY